jgi:hypothetical protein
MLKLALAAALLGSVATFAAPAHAWSKPECEAEPAPLVCTTSQTLGHTEGNGRTVLSFGMYDGKPLVMLSRAGWSMPMRDTTVNISVDRGPAMRRPVRTAEDTMIITVQPDDFAMFAKARVLNVQLPAETRWYSLDGSALALRGLLETWATYASASKPRTSSDPFAAKASDTTDPFQPIAF